MTRARRIPETIIVHVPFRLVKRGGRKEMVLTQDADNRCKLDNTLIKALARAFRWRRMVETGKFATVSELAAHDRIPSSYITRVMRLTLLSPDRVEAIFEGRNEHELTLATLMRSFPLEWVEQTSPDG